MVKLIQKSGFIQPGKAAGHIKYIAARYGVEMIGPEGYLAYMATRSRSHGLFSSQPVDLDTPPNGRTERFTPGTFMPAPARSAR